MGPGPRAISPELIAALFAALVIVAVGGSVLAGGPRPAAPSTAPEGSPGASTTPAPTPVVDGASIDLCLAMNARLEQERVALDREAAASPFQASDVAETLRLLNADVVVAIGAAARLERLSTSALVGTRLTTFYVGLHGHVSDALANSIQFPAAYRTAAKTTSAMLAELPALNALLEGLREGRVSPSSSPIGPSASPSASPSPNPTKTPVPTPSPPPPSPTSTLPPPASPSVAPTQPATNDIVDPGFETGIGAPWELSVSSSATATWTADTAVHEGGTTSARVDIAVAGPERASVAVRQGGLAIEAGSHYLATISVRADTTREVVLRIASADGVTYATRLFSVGPEWQVLTVDNIVFATDSNAYLEVDLGRFSATTWLDDASFTRVAPTGG